MEKRRGPRTGLEIRLIIFEGNLSEAAVEEGAN